MHHTMQADRYMKQAVIAAAGAASVSFVHHTLRQAKSGMLMTMRVTLGAQASLC